MHALIFYQLSNYLCWLWLIFANYPWFSVLVGDFLQPFEIIVDLKGVLQEASMMYINVYQKSRKLHCGAVRAHHHSYQSCCPRQCDVIHICPSTPKVTLIIIAYRNVMRSLCSTWAT